MKAKFGLMEIIFGVSAQSAIAALRCGPAADLAAGAMVRLLLWPTVVTEYRILERNIFGSLIRVVRFRWL